MDSLVSVRVDTDLVLAVQVSIIIFAGNFEKIQWYNAIT